MRFYSLIIKNQKLHMTTKVVSALKHIGLFTIVFFSIISCEKEIESIGVDLVDNNNFSNSKLTSEVVTENINVDGVISSNIQQYLLGVYSDVEFGKLKGSIVSQLSLPLTGEDYDYGVNAAIDSVILDIPYQVTRRDTTGGKPPYSIDSIFGNPEVEFKLNVYELKTFLNTLDPEDPSKNAVYYSDKEFQKGAMSLFSGNFKVDASDNGSYIKRYMADGTLYDTDIIKKTDSIPSIKLPLNEEIIQQIFVDNADGVEFSSNEAFQHYFRGFFIEAEELTDDKSHIVSLSMANAKMTIYYSNDEDEGETQDLNGNGTLGEQGVRVKHDFAFSLGSIKSNVLVRDDSNSKNSGDDRLYVQGAAGYDVTIELFGDENLEELQNNNWLITNASLTFYVDQGALSNIAPEQLFIYNYDESIQIHDMATEGITAVGGMLERDEDGNPYKYEFKITDYISELLKSDEPLDLVKLGIKVYNPFDKPFINNNFNNKVSNFNWNPKGVVLYGDDMSAGDKRIKLEISYSEINN